MLEKAIIKLYLESSNATNGSHLNFKLLTFVANFQIKKNIMQLDNIYVENVEVALKSHKQNDVQGNELSSGGSRSSMLLYNHTINTKIETLKCGYIKH